MAEIPTMECSQCGGSGCAWEPPAPACGFCDGTGRIPRPPLAPDEIAALPDWTRIIVEWLTIEPPHDYCTSLIQSCITHRRSGFMIFWTDIPEAAANYPAGRPSRASRVWLAEEHNER